ncbi:18S rRNA (guanine1575-N7)-methyltransferase [Tieghemiomyces parasiticus]|uniref:18S rRNA (Guanine1575-N7)-methyltransferase n=1 Tax=Tieghemiomyces parasiticus TaxID=78921 RepID=A0A9W8AEK9_9FUNG|nr:18S rRNA (guanine1575-N7)-methyltransferase [Tieghemiomyces parasiticus]
MASYPAEMALRALELLCLPEDQSSLLLDIGCGSGLSGEVLEDEGHTWVGLDISPSMLDVALEREVEGDLMLHDIGQGMAFRPGVFDGAISKVQVPKARLTRFFSTLYSALARGSRAVFQMYPENDNQLDLIMTCATRCGFTGGLVIDYPNSKKAKKFYLCLFAGQAANGPRQELPQGLGVDDPQGAASGVQYSASDRRLQMMQQRSKGGKGKTRTPIKSKDWILRRKELAKLRGEKTASDSKFTGRKRRPQF